MSGTADNAGPAQHDPGLEFGNHLEKALAVPDRVREVRPHNRSYRATAPPAP